jgi:hypothetical protein
MAPEKPNIPTHEVIFPWALVEEVFDLIHEGQIHTMRYCDLGYQRSLFSSRLRYIDEYVRFRGGNPLNPLSVVKNVVTLICLRASCKGGKHLPLLQQVLRLCSAKQDAPVLFLQHDADSRPDKTLEMMSRERDRGIKSSSYFFVEHAEGETYSLDIKAMQDMEQWGHEIGYHQNAYERCNYEYEQARKLVEADLEWLQRYFDIRSFVPHGGRPSPKGLNNVDFPHVGKLKPLLWAYNGRCVLKECTWSDGGMKKRKVPPIDPREYIKRLPKGVRAMMLMHPQYYRDCLRPDWRALSISNSGWWRALWGL